MSSNSPSGSYRTTEALMMRAFDKLPPEVRRALADAVSNHVPQPLLTRLKRGDDPDFLLTLIRIWDRQDLAREREKLGEIPGSP
jgi:hypothetical protein